MNTLKIQQFTDMMEVTIYPLELIKMIYAGIKEQEARRAEIKAAHGVEPPVSENPFYLTLRDDDALLSIRFRLPS